MEQLRFTEAETPQIQVESWSNSSRILQVRGFNRDGTLSHDHTTSGDRSRASTIFDVSDLPVMMQVSPAVAPVRRGECYVRVTLLMGGFPVGRLIAGYITDGMTLAWPGGKFENFTDGAGLIRVILGTNPAAGAEVSETVPTNVRWRVLTVRFSLTTDATVFVRYVNFVLDDGSTIVVQLTNWGSQAENLTYVYNVASGFAVLSTGTLRTMPMPIDVVLPQGSRIRTITSNIQAGDDYGAPALLVEEWIEE